MTSVRRGVFRSHMLTADGHPYLVAVTSDRRVIARAAVYPWDNEADVADALWAALHREDPQGEPWQQNTGGDHG